MLKRLVNICGTRALAIAVGLGLLAMASASAQASIVETTRTGSITTLTDVAGNFNIFYGQPISPLSGQYLVTFTLQGALTDGLRDGASLEFFTLSSIGAASLNNSVTPILNAGPETFTTGPYGPYSVSTIVDTANFGGSISTLNMQLSFKLSGGGDSFAYEVKVAVDRAPVVPVPSAAGMGVVVLGGMAGLGALRRRRPI